MAAFCCRTENNAEIQTDVRLKLKKKKKKKKEGGAFVMPTYLLAVNTDGARETRRLISSQTGNSRHKPWEQTRGDSVAV